jgi:hypothetical protein
LTQFKIRHQWLWLIDTYPGGLRSPKNKWKTWLWETVI